MPGVHTISGQTGTVVITAEQVGAGDAVEITDCTDAELELLSATATKVTLKGCTRCVLKVSVGTKIESGTLEIADCTTVEVRAAIKVDQITIANTTGVTVTFNKTEQLGKIGHTGGNGVAVGFTTTPEYNVTLTEASLTETLAAATAGGAAAAAAVDLSAATFVTHFVDEEVVTDEAGALAAQKAAAANAARPISAATAAEKREMLTKAKKALGDKKPEGNEYVIADKKGETVFVSGMSLPPNPVLLLKGNEDCTIDLADTTTCIKLLINGCKACKVLLPASCKLITSVVEVWDCHGLTLEAGVKVGTLQVDISSDITLCFATTELLGQVVGAGVLGMKIQFAATPDDNIDLTQTVLEGIAPGIKLPEDKTTQFTTRLIDGKVLTEEIIRLANDYPTTLREKEKHDRDLVAKDAALTEMAAKMLGEAGLSVADKEELTAKVKSTSEKQMKDLESESGNEARVEYKKRQGTEMFKAKDYQQAAVHYTEAINIQDDIPAIYANRCMCWLKLAEADKALADADKCIELDPKYTKAHFRRGVALLELDRYVDACKSFRTTLDLDPKNSQAKSSMMLAEKKMMMSRK